MSLTVYLDENQQLHVTDQLVEAVSPDQVDFRIEGTLSMTEELLSAFEGSSLKPTAVDILANGSQSVEIDLAGEASLWLEDVDVGVETPDADDISSNLDLSRSVTDTDDESGHSRPGAIAFTVEGTVQDVPAEKLEPITDATLEVTTVQFTVEDPARTDGGSGASVVLDLSILGYGITIYRNGSIDVDTDRS